LLTGSAPDCDVGVSSSDPVLPTQEKLCQSLGGWPPGKAQYRVLASEGRQMYKKKTQDTKNTVYWGEKMLTFEGGRGQVFRPLIPPIILSKHVYQNTGMSSLANMVVFSLEENSLYLNRFWQHFTLEY
jgi:hypothetical protein